MIILKIICGIILLIAGYKINRIGYWKDYNASLNQVSRLESNVIYLEQDNELHPWQIVRFLGALIMACGITYLIMLCI